MSDEKVIKAAETIKQYCKKHKCPDCLFFDNGGIMPICSIAKSYPTEWIENVPEIK